MIIVVPDILDEAGIDRCRRVMGEGASPSMVDDDGSRRLSGDPAILQDVSGLIHDGLERSPLFIAAAFPAHITSPYFAVDRPGDHGQRLDRQNVSIQRADGVRVRADLSAWLFLTDPATYDGGEFVVDGVYGRHGFRPDAGSLLLVSAAHDGRRDPVTRGERLTASFQIQSMIGDDEARALLFDLDMAVQGIDPADAAIAAEIEELGRIYRALARQWIDRG